MAKCKYCHEDISRLDKEICPFCGGTKPLEGTDDSTQDITSVINVMEHQDELKLHFKFVAALLSFFLGFLGVHAFYLGKMKKGLIILAISLAFIGGLGSIIFFAAWKSPFAYLIPYFVIEALMIGVGIGYLTKHNIVDSNGAFLK